MLCFVDLAPGGKRGRFQRWRSLTLSSAWFSAWRGNPTLQHRGHCGLLCFGRVQTRDPQTDGCQQPCLSQAKRIMKRTDTQSAFGQAGAESARAPPTPLTRCVPLLQLCHSILDKASAESHEVLHHNNGRRSRKTWTFLLVETLPYSLTPVCTSSTIENRHFAPQVFAFVFAYFERLSKTQ